MILFLSSPFHLFFPADGILIIHVLKPHTPETRMYHDFIALLGTHYHYFMHTVSGISARDPAVL